jgi:hypothetical protein
MRRYVSHVDSGVMGPQPECRQDDTRPTVSREKGFVRAGQTNKQKGICHTPRLHLITLNYLKPESHIHNLYKNKLHTLQKTPCLYYKEQKHINIYGNS